MIELDALSLSITKHTMAMKKIIENDQKCIASCQVNDAILVMGHLFG